MKKRQKQKARKKLHVSRETVRRLNAEALQDVRGGNNTMVPGISKFTCCGR